MISSYGRFVVVLSCLLYVQSAHCQSFFWATSPNQATTAVLSEAADITTRPGSREVYVAGNYSLGSRFQLSDSDILDAFGGKDIFLTRLADGWDPVGQRRFAPRWSRRAGGIGDDEALSLDLDVSGNVYVTGYFTGTAAFEHLPVSGATTNIVSSGNRDIFVAKYDAQGDLLWVRRAGGLGIDRGRGISVDDQGNCYVTGQIFGSADFGTTNLTALGVDIFLAKYSPSGNLQWVVRGGVTTTIEGLGVAAASSNHVYIAGSFTGQTTLNGQTLSDLGAGDLFLAQYDAQGALQWVRTAGSTSRQDIGRSVSVDHQGRCYVTGHAGMPATFGPTNVTGLGALETAFVACYDKDGVLGWVKRAGDSPRSDARTFGTALAVDDGGDSYVTGYHSGTDIAFEGQAVSGQGGEDIFVAKYSSTGTLQFVRSTGGTLSDRGTGIAVIRPEEIFVTGHFDSPQVSFGAYSVTPPPGAGAVRAVFAANMGAEYIDMKGITNGQELTNPATVNLQVTLGNYAGSAVFSRLLEIIDGTQLLFAMEISNPSQSGPDTVQFDWVHPALGDHQLFVVGDDVTTSFSVVGNLFGFANLQGLVIDPADPNVNANFQVGCFMVVSNATQAASNPLRVRLLRTTTYWDINPVSLCDILLESAGNFPIPFYDWEHPGLSPGGSWFLDINSELFDPNVGVPASEFCNSDSLQYHLYALLEEQLAPSSWSLVDFAKLFTGFTPLIQSGSGNFEVIHGEPAGDIGFVTSLTIDGPVTMMEGATTNFSALATFSGAVEPLLVPAAWSLDSPQGFNYTLDTTDVLQLQFTAGQVDQDTVLQFHASYERGIAETDTHTITVLDTASKDVFLTDLGFDANGKFTFIVRAVSPSLTGQLTIEASANLISWGTIFSMHVNSFPFQFTDPTSSIDSTRFYRASVE